MQNPTLYVQINNDIIIEAEKTHPTGGVFFLHINDASDADNLIRESKAKLQSAECELSIQRVNIYVIAHAHDPDRLVVDIGERLRILFAEDFANFHITLAVLLDESNKPDLDYETHNKTAFEFLTALTGHTAFDRIFLLSNRNEHGRIYASNHKEMLLAYLPILHTTDSNFNEAVTAKAKVAGRVLFASAGVGVCDEVKDENSNNRKLHKLAQILEAEMTTDLQTRGDTCPKTTVPKSIVADIGSVAAKPLSSLNLKGMTVKDAEYLLYGNSAANFFERNYAEGMIPHLQEHQNAADAERDMVHPNVVGAGQETFTPLTVPNAGREAFTPLTVPNARREAFTSFTTPNAETTHPETPLLLRDAISEEKQLALLLETLPTEISFLSQELSKKERTQLGFFRGVDVAKTAIGECYAIKYKIASLQTLLQKATLRHNSLFNYIGYMREVIESLKSLPVDPPPEIPQEILISQVQERAALNISLLRDDGLIHETHIFDETSRPVVLRLIGGFALEDLTRYNAMRLHRK